MPKRHLTPVPLGAQWRESARRALVTETEGMQQLIAALDGPLGDALAQSVKVIRGARGRVVMTGMGKSGHIARKIAATLASTGTPAGFVHPAEASHGDLGMITPDDAVVMISNSGESPELRDILTYSRRFAVPLIAITSAPDSTLGKEADIVLPLPRAREACPNGLAPTTSTLLQLALGDALAIALLEDKGFSAHDFRKFHPGGKLGAQLKHVRDIMHAKDELPLGPETMTMPEVLIVMTRRSYGCFGVVGADGQLTGIVTDGDLRRNMAPDLLNRTAGAVMTKTPRTIAPDALASEALEQLNSLKITSLFVIDAQNKPVGLVHIHDLLRIGLV
ncbi:MAG: KpsF/GutQ family sugar-phosphate isomerase [Aestuariivirga sp.]|nr:KpsF/GutQ family sugar-phosphate isomerase [Aestuariivirga sp.]MCA3556546.1 KpsF/GutQ family sugar-phosphate isomerase [Aestuariivirga sp.]